jgi:hypothetical protein
MPETQALDGAPFRGLLGSDRTLIRRRTPGQAQYDVKVSLTVGQVLRLLWIGRRRNLWLLDQFAQRRMS